MLGAHLCQYCSVSRKNQPDYLCSFRPPTKTHTQSQGAGVFLVAQAGRALFGAYRSSQDLNAAVTVTSHHTYGKHLTAKSIIKTYFYAFEPCEKLSAKLIAKLAFQGIGLDRSFIQRPLCFILFLRALRSEEHTSELQSLRHLVCRLLLEK